MRCLLVMRLYAEYMLLLKTSGGPPNVELVSGFTRDQTFGIPPKLAQ